MLAVSRLAGAINLPNRMIGEIFIFSEIVTWLPGVIYG
jgi:hypothetical protein